MGESLKEDIRQEWRGELRVGAWRKWHRKWAYQTRGATKALVALLLRLRSVRRVGRLRFDNLGYRMLIMV